MNAGANDISSQGTSRNQIRSFSHFKSAFIDGRRKPAGLNIYLVDFPQQVGDTRSVSENEICIDLQTAILRLAHNQSFTDFYQITARQYLLINNRKETVTSRISSVDATEKSIRSSLSALLPDVPVMIKVRGEIYRDEDQCLSYTYVRCLKRLQSSQSAAPAKQTQADMNTMFTHDAIETALDTGQIISYYQPVLNVKEDLDIVSFNSCLIWNHETLGALQPATWMKQLNKDQTLQVIMQMIEHARITLSLLRENGYHDIRLNISTPYDLVYQGHLTRSLLKQSKKNQIQLPLDIVITEIPENIPLHSRINTQIETLRLCGYRVFLQDHCGSGRGSENWNVLLADGIKADPLLARNMSNPMVSYFTEVYLDRLRKRNLLFFFPGVESSQGLNSAKQAGVEYAQGEYFSVPKEIDSIIEAIKPGVA